jgi:hypothetical protein
MSLSGSFENVMEESWMLLDSVDHNVYLGDYIVLAFPT